MKRKGILGIVLLGSAASSLAEVQVIHAGKLLVNATEEVRQQHTLVVEDGKVRELHAGFVAAEQFGKDARVIDLKDNFVMPGLIDTHVHLQFKLGENEASESRTMSNALTGMRSLKFAQDTLKAGFTTVRDLGSHSEQMYAMRDAIARGWVQGPRIVAAKAVAITGGHLDVNGLAPELLDLYTQKSVCDGPYDCRRATRRAVKYGADWIKLASTGGVLSDTAAGTGLQMEADELEEVTRAAARMGRKVAVHAHHQDGVNAALKAGATSVEHASYADASSYALFKKHNAYLVPTLLAGETVKNMAHNSDFMSQAIKDKAIMVGGVMQKNFINAYRAGVNIAFGTDSGVSEHGQNAREAILMHQAGMPARAILKSATLDAAKMLQLDGEIGSLESGKQADIIAMSDSPLNDIEALTRVSFVMKGGQHIR